MTSRRKKQRESAPGWAWMLFGLSIGLAVALAVYLHSGVPGPREFVQARVSEAPVATRAAEPVADPAGESSDPIPAEEEPTGNPAVDESSRTELGFYTDLVDSEVVVSDDEFDFDFGSEDGPRPILLQAGSFPALEQANARRADLALIGIESSIERAIVDRDVYFRVNVGPLSERGEINRTMRQLRQHGIEYFRKDIDD